jgi:uncharacterized membrane protein
MTDGFIKTFAEWCAMVIEALGVGLIAGLSILSLAWAAFLLARRVPRGEVYRQTRRRLGHGILLGLELLVAADIIHTVAVELSFHTVGTLAIIVAIRTFLSFTLEVELEGRWPWQAAKEEAP